MSVQNVYKEGGTNNGPGRVRFSVDFIMKQTWKVFKLTCSKRFRFYVNYVIICGLGKHVEWTSFLNVISWSLCYICIWIWVINLSESLNQCHFQTTKHKVFEEANSIILNCAW